jgi:DNA-binding NarL/FixJ family response regulator
LARGLANARIAATLSIETWTVDLYIANLLGKPGLENRAQFAAWAATHGIGEVRKAA